MKKRIKEDLPIKLKDLISTVNINNGYTDERFADHHGLYDGGGSPSAALPVELDTIDTADDIDPGYEAVGGADESKSEEQDTVHDSLPKESQSSLKSIMREIELEKGRYTDLKSLNEFGPLAGSGNRDELENKRREARTKSERKSGETFYVVGGKNGSYKVSSYYEDDNTYAAYHNGMAIPVNESRSSLKSIMSEIELEKGRYTDLKSSDVDAAKEELFNLIQTAYAPIGGHLKFKSPSDISDPELKHWVAADIDSDPDIDVVYFGKKTPFGIKHTGMGHDGDRANIKNLLIQKSSELKKPGNYVELSGAAFDSFVGKGGVPTIDDEELVRKILGPRRGSEAIWHGAHPSGKKPGNGWYTRKIGGKETTKIMAGRI